MAYFTPYTIVDFFSGSQRCGSLVFFYFQGKSPAVYRANKPANVESTLLKGEKQKRLREKAEQNPQISKKSPLLVKKTRKNLHISKSSQPKMVNNDPKTRS